MEKYLIDIHVHTAETSNCGQTPAAETVRLYHSLGYNGIMVTDHLHSYTKKRHNSDVAWDDLIDFFLTGYKNACEEAKNIPGFKVYLGCELRFKDYDNDYLVFGLSEDKLRKLKGIQYYETEEGIKLVQSMGCTVIQAHPFRDGMTVIEPGLTDGIEIHNGHKGHDSRNEIAARWAEMHDFKIRTAGTDFHGEHDPNSGIYVNKMPADEKELQQVLINGEFELKAN